MVNVSCSTSTHKAKRAKRVFVLPSGTPRWFHWPAIQRLTCKYQLGGFNSWTSTLDGCLRLCREVLPSGKGALLDDLKQFIGQVWSEWGTVHIHVTQSWQWLAVLRGSDKTRLIICFKSPGLCSREPLVGRWAADQGDSLGVTEGGANT